MIEAIVLAKVGSQSRITFDVLCGSLPFARASISKALSRLKTKGKIHIGRDCCGEYWAVSLTDAQKGIDPLALRNA